MTIKEIIEIENDKLKLGAPIKETMNIHIPDIDINLNILVSMLYFVAAVVVENHH